VSVPPFSTADVELIHAEILDATGGTPGLRDRGLLQSALANLFATFQGRDLYPTATDKAAILAFGIVRNHPFIDGNKRTAAVLLITFLRLNGLDLSASDEEAEAMFLELAAGRLRLNEFGIWVLAHAIPYVA